MLRYDEPLLISILENLAPRARIAFATACAERLRVFFGYPDAPSTPQPLEAALDALRQVARGEKDGAALQAAVRACEDSLDADDDAVAAVIYASRTLGADSCTAAAWAARRAYEARDRLVSDSLNADFTSPGSEQLVLQHPIVQAELQRQATDLSALSDSQNQVSSVLERARAAAKGRDAV